MDRIWINSTGNISYIEDDKIKIIDESYNINLNLNFNVFHTQDSLVWLSYLHQIRCFTNNCDSLIAHPSIDELPGPKCAIGEYKDTLFLNCGDLIIKYHENAIIDSVRLATGFELKNFKSRTHWLEWPYLLYTNSEGLNKYNFQTKKSQLIYNIDETIKRIQIIGDKLFFLTTHAFIIADIDEEVNIISSSKLFDDIVTSNFHIDKEENLWLANYKSGLYFFPKLNQNIQIYDCSHVSSNHMESIIVHDKGVYAGTDDNLILKIKDDTIIPFDLKLKKRNEINRILDMHTLSEDELLVSTDAGILKFSEESIKMLLSTNSKKIFFNDTLLLTNSFNKSYGGSLDKLLSVEEVLYQSNISEIDFQILGNNRTYSSIVDKKGNIWLGDVVKGLTRITDEAYYYYKEKSKIFNATINKITEMDQGIIATATNGEGLILIKDEAYFQIDKNLGLSGNICYNLFYQDGILLVATNRGMSVIKNLDFQSRTFDIQLFNKESGLPSNEVTGVAYDNNIAYLSTNTGVAKVDLNESNKRIEKITHVNIEEFYVNDNLYDLEDISVLKPHENNVLIKFSTPTFKNTANTVYAYKLSNIDDEWIVTTSNETHYSNLEPGNYTFQVKPGIDSKDHESAVTTMQFSVKPRFHETLLFQYLMAFLSLFLLFGILKYYNDKKRTEDLKKLVDIRTNELENKMQDLAIANEKLSKSNKELEEFAYITSHDLQEPLTTINGFAQLLKKKSDQLGNKEFEKYIDIIDDSSQRMKNLIKDLLIYSKIGSNKVMELTDLNKLIQDIESDMTNKISTSNAKVNYNNLPTINCFKLEVRLLFQNLISNAIKFQSKTVHPIIDINFIERENEFEFEVKDNGIGIEQKNADKIFNIFQRLHTKQEYNGTGIGLSHSKKIVELHSGKIWVKSKIGVGSSFYFTIKKTK